MHALLFSSVLHVFAAADPVSVLIMPLANKEGVSSDLAEQLTAVITHEASQLEGFRIVSVAEVQGAMSQEQMKQVAMCDQISCAAEIGGALDTEQVVIGTLGRLGDEMLLNLTRIHSKKASRIKSVSERIPANPPSAVLDRLAIVVPQLFGLEPPASALVVKPAPVVEQEPPPLVVEKAPPPPTEEPRAGSPVPMILRGVGGVGLGLALLPLMGSLVLGAIVGALILVDGGPSLPGKKHNFGFPVAVMGDLSGALSVVLLVVSVLGLAISAAVLGASLVVPS